MDDDERQALVEDAGSRRSSRDVIGWPRRNPLARLPPTAVGPDRFEFSRCDSHVQLLTESGDIDVSAATRFGEHPFDTRRVGACELRDTMGLNLLTELSVVSHQLGEADRLRLSNQFVGIRVGLLRPERLVIIEQKVYAALVAAKVTGCSFERVHEAAF